jgi:reductive dehalogenase
MKGVGLAGVSLGAAAAASPVFHDLDEAAAYPHYDAKTPWYMSERPHTDPVMEVDWNAVKRFDQTNVMNTRHTPQKYATGVWDGQRWVGEYDGLPSTEYTSQGAANWQIVQDLAYANAKKFIEQNKPGFTMRDFAVEEGTSWGNPRSFLGPKAKFGPDFWDVPKYQGTPEENAKTLRAFMRHAGAFEVGFLELDDKISKFVYTRTRNAPYRSYEFEDVDIAYETDAKQVIPRTAKWVIVFICQMSPDDYQAAPSAHTRTGSNVGYSHGANIQWCTQKFLKALGYQCLGEDATNTLGIFPAFGTMSGIIEPTRFNQGFNHYVGAMYRGFHMITDFPLAPTPPVDAGMFQFCRDCVKCAESCPPQSISYEKEPFWEPQGAYNNPGKRAYFVSRFSCHAQRAMTTGGECAMCQGTCVFTKKAQGTVHDFVKAVVGTTPILNGFFTTLDKAFGYPTLSNYWPLQRGTNYPNGPAEVPDEEFNPRGVDWWVNDLPVFGFDTTLGCSNWKK